MDHPTPFHRFPTEKQSALYALERRLYHEALASHFPTFLKSSFATLNPSQAYTHSWHLDAISEYLQAMERGDISRLIINMPPRSLKSLSITVAWTAFLLGRDPATKIITASYSSAISLKHAMDTRALIQQPWYGRAFPEFMIMPGQNEKHKFVTSRHGFRLATSVGGSLTGEGGDVLIIDDPLNPEQAYSAHYRSRANQWFDHTFATRLNNKQDGAMLVVMQRLHEEDLSGHLLGKGGWDHLCLPAVMQQPLMISCGKFHKSLQPGDLLQPERETPEILEQLRIDLGSAGFAAQYLQSPACEEGYMVRKEWLSSEVHLPDAYDMLIHSWDTAIKTGAQHDQSACVTIGLRDGHYYICDVHAVRLDYTELRQLIITLADKAQPDAVVIEDKASGQSLIQDLRQTTHLPIVPVMPQGDKVHRLARITPLMEAGRIMFEAHAPWLESIYDELLRFPHGRHDDQVDALSQGVHWLQQRQQKQQHIRIL